MFLKSEIFSPLRLSCFVTQPSREKAKLSLSELEQEKVEINGLDTLREELLSINTLKTRGSEGGAGASSLAIRTWTKSL